ncbi:hypothetical protein Cgig2_001552 [Carnegiea gigantea]|uniref:DUF4283 domain-containing protein n=1 Tax=Carnegiea gigantea TaxID=171969 RepID=A0A9Q1JJ35_9CARY|nr:hypothetical protein Cgig2_001552 [Carnegiea gigantea]
MQSSTPPQKKVTMNVANETVVKPTYASLVDPNEGTALEFIPAADINGVKCAKVDFEDIEEEVNYWHNAVLCCILGANPPLAVIEGYVKRIWKDYAINKVLLVKKGFYLVRFEDYQDTLQVIQKGFFTFDQKPFIVKPWSPKMNINTESISSLPIWVHFPELDIKYWGLNSLSKIGSMLGVPLKTDKHTKEKIMLRYARLLIEMPLDGKFPEYVEFANEKGVIIRQMVQYEWLPIKCAYCKMYRHSQEECRKKNPQRKEWRVKAPTAPLQPKPTSPVPQEGEGEFQPVIRHITRNVDANEGDAEDDHIHANPFQTLSEHEQTQEENITPAEENSRGPPPDG